MIKLHIHFKTNEIKDGNARCYYLKKQEAKKSTIS